MSRTKSRIGPLIQGTAALVALAILLGLGTWQGERKVWKEALVATLTERSAADPITLSPPGEWPQMVREDWEFRRVKLIVNFGGGGDALVYTGSSALRDDVDTPGYFVFAPSGTTNGGVVVINRGFVRDKSYPRISDPKEIIGALRWPEAPSWFIAAHDTAGEVWHVRDHRAMAQLKAWGTVAPFYLEQEAPIPAGGLPHPSPLKVQLRNNHLQYAVTWYGLAAALTIVSVVFLVRRRRELRS